MVPGFFEGFAAVDADMEDHDGAAGFAGEHYRAGFGDVTRAARAVNGERAIEALFEAARHDGESAKTAS